MRRVLVGLAVCAVSLVAVVPAASASLDSADLSVSIAWVGKGTPRVQSGAVATWIATVTNHGPDAAVETMFTFGGTDQWDHFTTSCGDSFCDLGTVQAGATITVTASARLCGLVPGESRDARVGASVSSSTPDPDETNNSTGDFVTKVTGKHGEPCTFP